MDSNDEDEFKDDPNDADYVDPEFVDSEFVDSEFVDMSPAANSSSRSRRYNFSRFDSTEDELIINFVKKNDCMFDSSLKEFKNNVYKHRLFSELGSKLNREGIILESN